MAPTIPTRRTAADGPRRPPHILLAEDDREFRALVGWTLRRSGFDVTECQDGVQLMDQLAWFALPDDSEGFDLIISDIRMPGPSGLDVLSRLFTVDGRPPMILITAFGDRAVHERAMRLGAAEVLDKPFTLEHLVSEVERLLSRQPEPSHTTRGSSAPADLNTPEIEED